VHGLDKPGSPATVSNFRQLNAFEPRFKGLR
jgi:hypothetical protein